MSSVRPSNSRSSRRSRPGTLLTVLAGISAALALLAAVRPQWIEALGFDPDAGSGFAEWAIPVTLGLVAVLLAAARIGRRAGRTVDEIG